MILARESFGKLPHVPENRLVGPIRRYYGSHVLAKGNRGRSPQRALGRRRLVVIVLVLHLEISGKLQRAAAQSGYPPIEHKAHSAVPRCSLLAQVAQARLQHALCGLVLHRKLTQHCCPVKENRR